VAIQAALMASSFVLVDDAFIGHTVDNRNSQNISRLRRFSACFARFLAEGVLATVELLERLLGNNKQNRPRIMPMTTTLVKGD